MSGLLPHRAPRLWLLTCAMLAGALLLLPGSRALGAEGERPAISGVTAVYGPEGDATLEAQIDPEGSETAYEFWLQCGGTTEEKCEPMGVSEAQGGRIAAGFGAHTVKAYLTNLMAGRYYRYGVLAVNAAGGTERDWNLLQTMSSSLCPNGCTISISPPETTLTQGAYEASSQSAAEASARQAAREREAREKAEREAPAKASQPSTASPPAQVPSSVSLADTAITVQSGRISLVALECVGSASCHGKLTLWARSATKANGKHRHMRAVAIGAASFSASGDEAKTVKVALDRFGRTLLAAAGGHLSASLEILELEPGSERTSSETVRLVRRTTATKRK